MSFEPAPLHAASLGETQRQILERLKRLGPLTLAELEEELGLAGGTLREHLNVLAASSLVARTGRRREGPGRPRIVYGLRPEAEALFPAREGALLAELMEDLLESGHREWLERFFERRLAERRERLLPRVEELGGEARLEEVARILSEEGFMAEVLPGPDGAPPTLRLCHCPIRAAVDHSRAPCRVELELVRDLLGEKLARSAYMPAGDLSCSYRVGGEAGEA